jgi:hypothetical protein
VKAVNAVALFDQHGDRAVAHRQGLARRDLFRGPELLFFLYF